MIGLFYHTHKTSGVFLNYYFMNACHYKIVTVGRHIKITKPLVLNDLVTASHPPNYKIEPLENYFKFTFIRNPFDWHVSCYGFYVDISHSKEMTKKGFKQYFLQKSQDTNFWLTDLYKYSYFDKGKNLLDYVGKFEEKEKSINEIFKILSIIPKISYKNCYYKCLNDPVFKKFLNFGRVRQGQHYSYYYDNELIDLVYEKEKEIIRKFNYNYQDKKC